MNRDYAPSVRLVKYDPKAPIVIASSGKSTISNKPFDELSRGIDRNNLLKWLKELFKRGHGSPFEHTAYSFEIICSRVCSHQLVRHRIASYTQLSQRWSDNYLRELVKFASKIIGWEVPGKPVSRDDYRVYHLILTKFLELEVRWDELLNVVSRAFIIPPSVIASRDVSFIRSLLSMAAIYYKLLSDGYSFEDARFILPQAIKTRIYVTMNARELVEVFLPLRMCSRAQWEIRFIAWSLWRELMRIHPEIFSYTGPRCVLYENRVRVEPCTLQEFIDGICSFSISRCPELKPSHAIRECIIKASMNPYTAVK